MKKIRLASRKKRTPFWDRLFLIPENAKKVELHLVRHPKGPTGPGQKQAVCIEFRDHYHTSIKEYRGQVRRYGTGRWFVVTDREDGLLITNKCFAETSEVARKHWAWIVYS